MEEIYRVYATPVYKYLFTLTSNADLTEELTQETFFQAVKSLHRYNGECKMLVWLCQIAKHLFYDYLKKEKHRGLTVDWERLADDSSVVTGHMPDNTLESKEGLRRLYRQIHALSDPYREVILLRISGELSFRDIGEIMEQTENWARVTFYRAKIKLSEEIKQDE